jgi:hypothetical protein
MPDKWIAFIRLFLYALSEGPFRSVWRTEWVSIRIL